MERIDLKITNPEVLLLRAQLKREQELRTESENLADVYGTLATMGWLLTTIMTVVFILIT